MSHTAWNEAAEYRFLDEALRQPDGDRTPLQRRALVAVELLSQAWLSWQPDTAFLSAVVALEALLGEPGDSTKKLRIARRVSYFICGWLEGSYAAGGRPACPLLALPLMASGQPGTELKRLMSDVKEGAFTPCTQFFGVLRLYDDRNEIVHGGHLGLTANEESHGAATVQRLPPGAPAHKADRQLAAKCAADAGMEASVQDRSKSAEPSRRPLSYLS